MMMRQAAFCFLKKRLYSQFFPVGKKTVNAVYSMANYASFFMIEKVMRS